MIMEWKRREDGTFHGYWRGAHLMLVENPVTKRWHMTADGKTVRQNWPTSRKAMGDVDNKQQRIVVRLAQDRLAAGAAVAHGA